MCKLKSIIEFKEHKLELEFLSPELDSRLYIIILAFAGYVYFNFRKPIMLTEIFRTKEMQDRYYKNNEEYKIKPWLSTHQEWRAIDLSLKYFTNDEIKLSEKFFNQNFIYTSNKFIKTIVIHDIGYGYHAHIQVDNDNYTSIKKII